MARQKLSNQEIAKRKREGRYHDGRRPLTAKIVQRLRGHGRYKDGFMPGLYLQVSETGTKSWLLRYDTRRPTGTVDGPGQRNDL